MREKKRKLITIMTPCYNEEANVENVYSEIKKIFSRLKQYRYEHIFIDNASKDTTVEILKGIAKKDRAVKIIVNSRNFGHVRSPHYGLLQGRRRGHSGFCRPAGSTFADTGILKKMGGRI